MISSPESKVSKAISSLKCFVLVLAHNRVTVVPHTNNKGMEGTVRQRNVMHSPTFFFLVIVIMKRGKDITSFFAPVNKKVIETAVRESNQGIERAEEQDEGEPEESVEIACDESEGSDTEREIPDGEGIS